MAGEIFISYRRTDQAWARRLHELLKAEGVDAWYDQQVGAGEDWRAATAKALEEARIVVLLFSQEAQGSEQVIKELAAATHERKHIVPIRLENIQPKGPFLYELAGRNWIDAHEDTDAKLAEVADDLAALVRMVTPATCAPGQIATPADPPPPLPASAPQVRSSNPAAAPDAVLKRPAVAILPFTNLSGDPSQEYFADGITEDLITALSAWRWFPVIARNSTFRYKGQAVDVTEVARALGARYVLEGSVRRAGARVRIAAQLIEAETAHHVWAKTYDREIEDVFALQDDITRAIVGAIEPHLSRAEQARALRKLPENLDAWDLALQGLAKIRRGTVSSLREAEKLLEQATAIDCTSSYAQSLLALSRFQGALAGRLSDPTGSFLPTYEAAREAVELDEGDWLAHALQGLAMLWCHGAYDAATAEVELAVELNPSAALAYHFQGCVLTFNDQLEAAMPRLEAVLKLDPHFQLLPATLADIGLLHFLLGDYGEAVRWCDRALSEQRDHVRSWQRKAAALGLMERKAEAEAAFAEVKRLQPEFGRPYLRATYPFRNPDHHAKLEAGLRAAGWTPD